MESLGVSRPHLACFKNPPPDRVFQEWHDKGINAVVTCPLGWTVDNGDLRAIQSAMVQRANGMTIVHAQPVFKHGEFMRLMVKRITSAEDELKTEDSG